MEECLSGRLHRNAEAPLDLLQESDFDLAEQYPAVIDMVAEIEEWTGVKLPSKGSCPWFLVESEVITKRLGLEENILPGQHLPEDDGEMVFANERNIPRRLKSGIERTQQDMQRFTGRRAR